MDLSQLVERSFFNNSLLQWIVAAGIFTLVFLVATVLRSFIRRQYQRLLETRQTELLELPLGVASKTGMLFIIVLGLFLSLRTLELPAKVDTVLGTIATFVFFWQVGLWASAAVVAWLERKRRDSLQTDRAAAGTLGIINFIARTLIWSFVLLLALDNIGIDITALVAGLGIGGIAIALAVQNVLGDLLASLTIALDKPFVIGDFLIVDDFLGVVEYIGVKSVRLRSLSGEQIVMANTDLLNSRVRNYGRMHERRVVFKLGVTYETPREKLKEIPGVIKDIIEAQENTRFDRSHFQAYGNFSLDYETVYYVLSADYNQYMDTQQAINFAIHEAFEQREIEFAYPTQKLWLARALADAEETEESTTDKD